MATAGGTGTQNEWPHTSDTPKKLNSCTLKKVKLNEQLYKQHLECGPMAQVLANHNGHN